MSTIKKQLSHRPRLSLGISLAVVALLAITLIPFKFDQTVGFEVAVAGVDREIAFNEKKIDDMLTNLGIQNAVVEVIGCDPKCELKVSELTSTGDVQLVIAAFEEIGKEQVAVQLALVTEEVSGSLVDHAKSVVVNTISIQTAGNTDEARQKVVETLGNQSDRRLECYTTGQEAVFSPPEGIAISHNHDGSNTYSRIGTGEIIGEGQSGEELVATLCAHGLNATLDEDGASVITIDGPMALQECSEEPTKKNIAKTTTDATLPEGYVLSQNYPNPFNPTTNISFSLPESQHVSLDIINVQGQKVRTLINEVRGAGDHSVEWDACSDAGNRVASGVYFYRLKAGDISTSRKMTLMK